MKKLIYGSLFLALVGIGIVGCKKENSIVPSTIPVTPNTYEIEIISNPYPATDYLANEEDKDDEKIRRQLYNLAQELLPIFVNNSYNELIMNEAKRHDNNCIKLVSFLEAVNLTSNTKSKIVANNILKQIPNLDLTHKPVGESKSTDLDTYIPAIFVVNIDVADMSKAPIISAGTCVNANQHPMDEYEDYIVAWLINGEGDYTELLINEEMAMNTTHPIFIIDNAEEFISTRKKQIFQSDQSNIFNSKNQETAWYSTYEHMIWNRFDNTNNSEFTITAAHIDNNGVVKLVLRNGFNFTTWKQISKVHKNDMGVMKQIWREFTINNVTPFDFNYIFWNTYERDWYASEKDLGSGTRNGKTIYLVGRRSNSSDIYGYQPGNLNSNPLAISSIYHNWARWYQNPQINSGLRFWRIQP